LVNVAKGYDGIDRSYLASLGIGAGHHQQALWKVLVETMKPGEPAAWSDTFARLTWRLKPEEAVAGLKSRALSQSLSSEQKKLAVDSLAFIKSKSSAEALMDLAAENSPVKDQARWWLMNRTEGEWEDLSLKPELEKRGLVEKEIPIVEMMMPENPAKTKYAVADVVALKGDAARGKLAAARCIMCHKIDSAGPDYGPDLKGFGSRQAPEVVAKAIIEPSADISHGFEGTTINLKDGKRIDGRLIADGDPLVIRSIGGATQKIPNKELAGRKDLGRSLMLSADQLGLTPQDVADIVEWLKTY
jgi:putative heme-binding domain-containing protein